MNWDIFLLNLNSSVSLGTDPLYPFLDISHHAGVTLYRLSLLGCLAAVPGLDAATEIAPQALQCRAGGRGDRRRITVTGKQLEFRVQVRVKNFTVSHK
jgi:hypothetical protein